MGALEELSATVSLSVYESAVKGRADFRSALRRIRTEHLPERVVTEALEKALETAGSYAELGRIIGVSDEYVRNMAIGQRAIRGRVLAYLGFEKVTSYRRSLATSADKKGVGL